MHILGAIAEFERPRIAERGQSPPAVWQDARKAAWKATEGASDGGDARSGADLGRIEEYGSPLD
jgi:hypothetical protein